MNPDGVTLADLNRDGKLDLIVANVTIVGSVRVFLGVGDGTFAAPSRHPMSATPELVVVADFDADGIVDIATSSVLDAPSVATGRGDGTFRRARSLGWIYAGSGGAADFNLDGRLDLVFLDTDVPEANVYLNWTGRSAAPCIVMDFRDTRLKVAKQYVSDGGCHLGRIRHEYSNGVRQGRVIGSRLPIGTVLTSRTRIDIVVSRGRRP